jgi:tetratricopeptide (TPR) repeat protein
VRRWATVALQHAERTHDDQTLALALEYLDHADVTLGHIEGEPRSIRSMEIYQATGDLNGQGRIHNSLGMRAYFRGRWPESLQHYASAAEAYRRAGRDWVASVSQANMAEVLSDQGHLEEARRLLEDSMRVWRGIGAESDISFGEQQLGRIAARSGNTDEAFARYANARAYCVEAGERNAMLVVDSYVAECHILAGQHERALEVADEVLARALATGGLMPSVPLLHRVRSEALRQLGCFDEAVDALRESLVTARQRDALHDIALALDGLILLGAQADDAEAMRWRSEGDELRTRLGMVPKDHPEEATAACAAVNP